MPVFKTLHFEVCGKVQGVFFRKHTKKTCDKHGVTGWVLNTQHHSVQGCLEGSENAIKSVKQWLQNVGSPKSKIDKCSFFDEKTITVRSQKTFEVIRNEAEVQKRTFKTT